MSMALLDDTLRRLLDRLALAVRARSTASRHGGHRSPVLASGLELADHRPYTSGDDFRRIDWKAFARHRQLAIRQFEEERDARVYVLVDLSSSMTRGAPPKVDIARRLTAALGYLGMKQFDRVRIVPFAAQTSAASRPFERRERLPALERFVSTAHAEGVTSFEATARDFARRFPHRGLVVVVTDLMAPDGWEIGLKLLGSLGHDLRVVRVTCDEDDAPDFRGEIELDDAETGELLRLRADKALLGAYREVVREHVDRVRSAARGAGGDLVETPVTAPMERLVRIAVMPERRAAR